jgi:hypothetical protein
MTIDELSQLLEQAAAAEGDRYPMLVRAHDGLREALAETDTDATAAGR